jgi:uncharacterized RDD family membrane protein YckC
MSRELIKSMSDIKEAHIVRRSIAALLDAVLAVFLFFLLMTYATTPIANKAMGYSDLHQDYTHYQTASHLYLYQQANEDGSVSLIEVKDYEKAIDINKDSKIVSLINISEESPQYLLDHLRYYYLNYLTGIDIEVPESATKTYDIVADKLVSPHFQEVVPGTDKLPSEYYTEEYFNYHVLQLGQEGEGMNYFDTSSLNERAIIKDGIDEKACMKFIKRQANAAQKELYYTDYMKDMNKKANRIQIFIIFVPYFFVLGLVYFLPSMLFKNGETLGKITMHVCVISKDGYKAKKRQIIFRFLVFLVELTLSSFILGIGLTSLATLGVGIFLLFIATVFTPKYRALHDLAAATMVIDSRTSVWFESKEKEDAKVKEFNDNLQSYNDYKTTNKNVIQVGGEIVDPELKKEIENKKKSK